MRLGPVGVVIVTRDRPRMLARCLEALLEQDSPSPFQVSVLDNGSRSPVSDVPEVARLLGEFGERATLQRVHDNLASPTRLEQAMLPLASPFAAMPGDDDIPLPHYVKVLSDLAERVPRPALCAGGVIEVGLDERPLSGPMAPAVLEDQPTALAHLLAAHAYWMPATAIRREAINLTAAPPIRSVIDRWMWQTAWLTGPAATTSQPILLYRQHPGQEQHAFTRTVFRLDNLRMQAWFLAQPETREALARWSADECDAFVRSLLANGGPDGGDTSFGAITQVLLADALAARSSAMGVAGLFAQGSVRLGAAPHLGAIQTLTGNPDLKELPAVTWLGSGVSAEWARDCGTCKQWPRYLGLAPVTPFRVQIEFTCRHPMSDRIGVEVRGPGDRAMSLEVEGVPSDASCSGLLAAIARATAEAQEVPKLRQSIMSTGPARRVARSRAGRALKRLLVRSGERFRPPAAS